MTSLGLFCLTFRLPADYRLQTAFIWCFTQIMPQTAAHSLLINVSLLSVSMKARMY